MSVGLRRIIRLVSKLYFLFCSLFTVLRPLPRDAEVRDIVIGVLAAVLGLLVVGVVAYALWRFVYRRKLHRRGLERLASITGSRVSFSTLVEEQAVPDGERNAAQTTSNAKPSVTGVPRLSELSVTTMPKY